MKLNSITAYLVVDLNGQTIADVRTDGKKCLVLDDKSNGIVTNLFRAGWVAGKAMVEESAQYKITGKTGVGIYYFNLSSGESLAVTTDDRSAALNGDILDEVDFEKLLHLLNTRQMTATSAGQGSPVSMLYNLAEHADDQTKPKYDVNLANHYSQLTQEDNDKIQEDRNAPNLKGLHSQHDAVAIRILKTQKVED